jgi:hypothetical protein
MTLQHVFYEEIEFKKASESTETLEFLYIYHSKYCSSWMVYVNAQGFGDTISVGEG